LLGDRREELAMAVWLFGCSYTAVLLVATRLALWRDRRRAFTLPHVLPLVIFLVPAAALALGILPTGNTRVDDLYIDLYVIPGMGGSVPGGLLAVLMTEALLRTRRGARPSTS